MNGPQEYDDYPTDDCGRLTPGDDCSSAAHTEDAQEWETPHPS
jgi:hypothetical protein